MSDQSVKRIRFVLGLIKAPLESVVGEFNSWQPRILSPLGIGVRMEDVSGALDDALSRLMPQMASTPTKYLFWSLNEAWTAYYDNGVGGTDAGAPVVMSSRLHVDAARVVILNDSEELSDCHDCNDPATIFEYYVDGVEVRHVFSFRDGEKWFFGQSGSPFDFELVDSYRSRLKRDRFTVEMLLGYLREMGVPIDRLLSGLESGRGTLISKLPRLPSA